MMVKLECVLSVALIALLSQGSDVTSGLRMKRTRNKRPKKIFVSQPKSKVHSELPFPGQFVDADAFKQKNKPKERTWRQTRLLTTPGVGVHTTEKGFRMWNTNYYHELAGDGLWHILPKSIHKVVKANVTFSAGQLSSVKKSDPKYCLDWNEKNKDNGVFLGDPCHYCTKGSQCAWPNVCQPTWKRVFDNFDNFTSMIEESYEEMRCSKPVDQSRIQTEDSGAAENPTVKFGNKYWVSYLGAKPDYHWQVRATVNQRDWLNAKRAKLTKEANSTTYRRAGAIIGVLGGAGVGALVSTTGTALGGSSSNIVGATAGTATIGAAAGTALGYMADKISDAIVGDCNMDSQFSLRDGAICRMDCKDSYNQCAGEDTDEYIKTWTFGMKKAKKPSVCSEVLTVDTEGVVTLAKKHKTFGQLGRCMPVSKLNEGKRYIGYKTENFKEVKGKGCAAAHVEVQKDECQQIFGEFNATFKFSKNNAKKSSNINAEYFEKVSAFFHGLVPVRDLESCWGMLQSDEPEQIACMPEANQDRLLTLLDAFDDVSSRGEPQVLTV